MRAGKRMPGAIGKRGGNGWRKTALRTRVCGYCCSVKRANCKEMKRSRAARTVKFVVF